MVEQAASVELVESVALAASVELEAGIARPRCPRVVADAATGNTIQPIAAGPLIEIERPRTDLEVPLAATPSPTDRPVPGNKLEGRAAICRATAAHEPEQATGPVAQGVATGLPAAAEPTALEVVICRAAVGEIGTHSAGGRAATADRALAPTAVAAHPAWDLEAAGVGVEGVEVEGVAAEGRRHGLRNANDRSTE